MPRRLAASLALLVFAICLIVGMESGNTLSTILSRALVAMLGTLVISLIVGTMAERMLEENVARKERELRKASEAEAAATGATEALRGPGGNGR
ncbi:hypothetical protein [Humisphaera borealis]|uniref:Uncharacterized protein n=1 Tax=Humisphaera borealis TaxID=2807512 RepID=A0A7M2X1Z2_9BACT|nr:hypothetical protein [Humisphaera borealis]QOV91609.1 hypothetical protein IPV69_09700 [Humisphaera borealis]